MSYLTDNWYWMVSAAASGGALLWMNLRNGGAGGGLSPQEVVMLMNREKATVIDISPAESFKAGHIRGARHVVAEQVDQATKALPSNKQSPVVVVCVSGMRARQTAKQLQQLGYERVELLKGGMQAWREANLPTEAAA